MDGIHRDSEVLSLRQLIEDMGPGVKICGISGPGGVGKSFLVEHVFDQRNLRGSGWLIFEADGLSQQLRGDFAGIIDKRLAPKELPGGQPTGADPFPKTRKILNLHRVLAAEAGRQLAAVSASPESRKLAQVLLKAGHVLNSTIPKSKEYLDFGGIPIDAKDIDQHFDEAWELVRGLGSITTRQFRRLPEFLRRAASLTSHDRVRNDFFELVAETYAGEVKALIDKSQAAKKGPSPLRALCFFIDDFEVLGPTMASFLFGHLFPKFERAAYPVLFLIVGRDDFSASNPDWHFKYQRYLKAQIRLQPFNEDKALDFLLTAGISPAEAQEIYGQLGGFPFLLRLAVDERMAEGDDGSSPEGLGVDLARRFFDRTTRWMNEQQVEWLRRLVYLEKVDMETLSWLFDADEAKKIQYWFERDGSIREPRGAAFRVREIVRKHVIHYLSVQDPPAHRAISALVEARRPAAGASDVKPASSTDRAHPPPA